MALWSVKVKRSIIFIVVLAFLAAVGGGLVYFEFVVKPGMIKAFISAAAPPPASVAVTAPQVETWAPRLPAIGTLRAVQEIDIAPQIGGAVVSVRVESGQDVEKGAPLFEIDNSVEQADLKNNLAVLKNAGLVLERQRQLIQGGNTAKAISMPPKPRAIQPPPPSNGFAPSSPRNCLPRHLPGDLVFANWISDNMFHREWASSLCSSSIRFMSISRSLKSRSAC